MYGKVYPYIVLEYGSFSVKTKSISNTLQNVTWDNLDFTCDLNSEDLRNKSLLIHVFDAKSLSGFNNLATCSLNISRAGCYIENEIDMSADLLDTQGKKVGKVVLIAKVSENIVNPEPAISLPNSFQAGIVDILSIKTFGLKNDKLLSKQVIVLRSLTK